MPIAISARICAGLTCSEPFDRRNTEKLTAATKRGEKAKLFFMGNLLNSGSSGFWLTPPDIQSQP